MNVIERYVTHGCQYRFPNTVFICLLMFWAVAFSGCATWPTPTPSQFVGVSSPAGTCADFFASLDEQIIRNHALDAGYARVKQYPYLRTDRFIASFRDDIEDGTAFSTWVDHMQSLDQLARRSEIANLSDEAVAVVSASGGRPDLYRLVADCGNRLKEHDFANTGYRDKLRNDVTVPDDYIPFRRVLGLYPITRIFVSRGIQRWHKTARDQFSAEPPEKWRSVRYIPAGEMDISAASRMVQLAQHDALGIPSYTSEARRILFRTHAPIWELQYQSDDDRIGQPYWIDSGQVGIDLEKPYTFTLLNFTRFNNAVHTQLNYVVWFPSRPKRGALDMYGGALDGLNYRVTLDSRGTPILYETVHNCGCYYKAYPTDRLQPRDSIDYAEQPLILKAPPETTFVTRMVVAMESGTHYVRHLYPNRQTSQSGDMTTELVDYAGLKNLPLTTGKRQSMFNRYGIVAGSERLERYVLWPTGVQSPGAMRQWGKHAVAFVGRRHFDDPFYLEQMFVPSDRSGGGRQTAVRQAYRTRVPYP